MRSTARRWTRMLLLGVVFWIVAPLVLAEAILRGVLFTDLPFGDAVRKPGLYADYWSDEDYWKLRYRLASAPPVRQVHEKMGWFFNGDPKTLRHNEADAIGSRRPVLLYGDSFARCYTLDQCFEKAVNVPEVFGERCHLLNYAQSEYGIGQISMLYEETVDHFDNPFVLLSLTTIDFDRSILGVRGGPKPHYVLDGDGLRIEGRPVEDYEAYHAEHPPEIWSYLYRLVVFNERFPRAWRASLRHEDEKKKTKQDLSRAILRDVIGSLRARGLDFEFVVFNSIRELDGNPRFDTWRMALVQDVFDSEGVPYLATGQLIRDDMKRSGRSLDAYFLADGHPGALQVELVTDAIAKRIPSCMAAQK